MALPFPAEKGRSLFLLLSSPLFRGGGDSIHLPIMLSTSPNIHFFIPIDKSHDTPTGVANLVPFFFRDSFATLTNGQGAIDYKNMSAAVFNVQLLHTVFWLQV